MASKSRPIEIEVIAQIAKTLSANKELEISFSDVAEAVLDVSKESDRSAKDVVTDLRKISKELNGTEKDAEDLARGAKRSFDRVGRSAKDAGRDTTRALGDLDSGTVGEEVGSEFAQGLGQAISSGNSEDFLQEAAGGLVSSLSQLAGPAGIAVSIGGGLAVALWQAFKDETSALTEEVKKSLGDALFAAYNEATGRLSEVGIAEAAITAFGGDDFEAGLTKVRELADLLGISEAEVTDIISAQGTLNDELRTGLLRQQEIVDAEITVLEQRRQFEKTLSKEDQEKLDRLKARSDAIQDGLAGIDETQDAVNESTKEAIANAQAWADINAERHKQDKDAESTAERALRNAKEHAKWRKEAAKAAKDENTELAKKINKTVVIQYENRGDVPIYRPGDAWRAE